MVNKQKGSIVVLVIIAILLIIGGFYVYKKATSKVNIGNNDSVSRVNKNQCSDNIDNDEDKKIDMDDENCTGPNDDTENVTTEDQNLQINNCDTACKKYVDLCLTLVPNATESLFNEGHQSCLSECKSWNTEKINCMIKTVNCESMTDVCGL